MIQLSSICDDWRCLECGQDALRDGDSAFVCRACSKVYPHVDGIATFLRDVEAHRRTIEEAKAQRAEWFTSNQKEYGPWTELRRMLDEQLASMLARHTNKGQLALDLGCGDGRNLRKLRDAGLRCVGTDYNVLRLSRAATSKDATYDFLFMADVRDLPVPDARFDVVYCDQVLEHIRQPEEVLLTVSRILKEDGILLLGVPNEGCWYHRLKFRIKPSLLAKTDHVNFFTEQTLRALLTKTGFTVRESVGMGWGLPVSGSGVLKIPTTIDAWLRSHAGFTRVWEALGSRLLPGQYFELYMACGKTPKGRAVFA